jgi:cyclic pyranopterin phosphate synthase
MTTGSDNGRRERGTLSHLSPEGSARMVDVATKADTDRAAVAEAWVHVGPDIARMLRQTGGVLKGSVLETARIAGVLAAKRTSELIPMCHPLPLDVVEIDAAVNGGRVHLQSHVTCRGRTGVEIEALTAVSIAALTIYDMVKSASKAVEIGPIRLLEKSGGKSVHWKQLEKVDGTC